MWGLFRGGRLPIIQRQITYSPFPGMFFSASRKSTSRLGETQNSLAALDLGFSYFIGTNSIQEEK